MVVGIRSYAAVAQLRYLPTYRPDVYPVVQFLTN